MADRVLVDMVGFIASTLACIASMIPFLSFKPDEVSDATMAVVFTLTVVFGILTIWFYQRLDEDENAAMEEREKRKNRK